LEFASPMALWVTCHSFTYLPRSNKCGPRSLLASAILATHPAPTKSILIPNMHPNIAQISRWWIAKSILNQSFELLDISGLFHHTHPVINHSWNQPANPFNLAPLHFQPTHKPHVFPPGATVPTSQLQLSLNKLHRPPNSRVRNYPPYHDRHQPYVQHTTPVLPHFQEIPSPTQPHTYASSPYSVIHNNITVSEPSNVPMSISLTQTKITKWAEHRPFIPGIPSSTSTEKN
jgi:hypothetical protein